MFGPLDRRGFLGVAGLTGAYATVGGRVRGAAASALQGRSGPSTAWTAEFDRSDADAALAATRGVEEGYLFGGRTVVSGETWNAWAVAVDGEGSQRWGRTFGGTAKDWVSAATTLPDGYLLAGQTASSGNGQLDAWLLRLDADGNAVWRRPYGGVSDDRASSVGVADGGADAGYTFAGGTRSGDNGGVDAWLVGVDPSGDELWNRVYGGSGDDWVFSHRPTGDGYILAGETSSAGSGGRDAWLLGVGPRGDPQWNQVYGGSDDDYARAVVPAADGAGYAFAGGTESTGSGGTDAWLVRAGPDGGERWSRTYGGENDDRAVALLRLSDGYLLAGATTADGESGTLDTWLLRVDASGGVRWSDSYGAPGTDFANAMVAGADGGPLVAGTVEPGGGTSTARLVKLSGDAGRRTATVSVEPSPPTAGVEATLTASLDGATVAGAEWDVGDTGTVDATGREVTHTFEEGGATTVRVDVTDGNGATVTARESVPVRILGSDRKLAMADRVDASSILSTVSDQLGADVSDRTMAERSLSGLRAARARDEIPLTAGREAVTRLTEAERATWWTLEYVDRNTTTETASDVDVGSAAYETDSLAYSERTARYAIEVVVEIVMEVLAIGKTITNAIGDRLSRFVNYVPDVDIDLPDYSPEAGNAVGAAVSRVPDWVNADSAAQVIETTIDDLVGRLLDMVISHKGTRDRARTLCKREGHRLFHEILDRGITAASELSELISDVAATITDLIADFIQSTFETGALKAVVRPPGVASIEALTGDSGAPWATLSRVHQALLPSELPASGSWPGDTATGSAAVDRGLDRLHTNLSHSAEWLELIKEHLLDFDVLGNVLSIIDSLQEIAQEDDGPWWEIDSGDLVETARILLDAVQAAVAILRAKASLFVAAGATAVTAEIVIWAGETNGRMVDSVLAGEDRLIPIPFELPTPDETADWLTDFADTVGEQT